MEARFELITYGLGAQFVIHRMNRIETCLHWHREIELVYVLNGCVQANVDDITTEVHSNQLLVVNQEQVHMVNNVGEGADLFVLQISEHLLMSLQQAPVMLNINTLLNLNHSDDTKDYSGMSAIKDIQQCVNEIINELNEPSENRVRNMNMVCYRMLALLIRYFSRYEDHTNSKAISRQQQRMKQIFAYVKANYTRDISQVDLAENICIHPSYLSRLFIAYTNTSFKKYLNTYRIEKVCLDLTATDDSITDIYLRNGFASAKTFNRVFRNITGVSPSEYRANLRANDGSSSVQSRHTKTAVGSYVNYTYRAETLHFDMRDYKFSLSKKAAIAKPTESGRTVVLQMSETIGTLRRPFGVLINTGRAHDLLLATWRKHFQICQREIGFQYLRFHGLLNDEMGVIQQKGGVLRYNFFYIDEALNYLLSQNVKPYIELSFMPTALASGEATVFAYQANITMPRSVKEWQALISALIAHLLDRFGRTEVENWYFEVWNEPDIDEFWADSFEDYLRLYEATCYTLKKICPTLRIGGPSGSSILFQTKNKLYQFLDFLTSRCLPLDFLSMHLYPAEFRDFYTANQQLEYMCAPSDMEAKIQWVHETLQKSPYIGVPLHMNEWNSSPRYDDYIHDTAYMATYVIDTSLRNSELCDLLGWWTVSDILDEGGVVYREFGGGFGLINRSGIKKPSFFGTWALSRLMENVLGRGEDYIVTRKDDRIVILLWNYVFYTPEFAAGDRSVLNYYDRYRAFMDMPAKSFSIVINGLNNRSLSIMKYTFDREHGCAFDFWLKHGAMEYMKEPYLQVMRENNHLHTEIYFMRNTQSLVLEDEVQRFGFVLYEIDLI